MMKDFTPWYDYEYLEKFHAYATAPYVMLANSFDFTNDKYSWNLLISLPSDLNYLTIN